MSDRVVLGWHLDAPKRLVEIAPDSIDQHTAVLAQSGGGKSFFLGRLIEEYLLKTKVRVVVLDVNGDFRKSYAISDKPWTNPRPSEHEPWRRLPGPEKSAGRARFEKRWAAVPQSHVTLDDAWPGPPAQRAPLCLRWCDFRDPRPGAPRYPWVGFGHTQRLTTVGLDLRADGTACRWFVETAARALKKHSGFITPDLHLEALAELREEAGIDQSALDRVISQIHNVRFMRVWATDPTDTDLAALLWEDATKWRLLKIDLLSIDGREARLVAADHALWALRNEARRQWERATRSKARRRRVPVFVLIDEAHNLVPEETGDAAMERVASQVMRIASEGRKFGLFLILATQRPAKLRRGLLAECENVCVMHLQSPVDHEAAAATWGGPSPEIARARHFGRGDGLLMGRWVPAATAIHAAWRRTEECGGRLDPDYWAKPWPPTDPPGDPP